MTRYICMRIIISIFTIFVLVTITFFLVKLLPGDPFMSESVPPEIRARQLAFYGLDRPIVEQYFLYLGNLLRGNLGTSLRFLGREVSGVIRTGFPISARLGIISVIFSYAVGLTFGILSSQFRGRLPDYVLMLVALIGVAMPSMVIGPLLRYIFGVRLGFLPVTGWGTVRQIIMPAFVMSLGSIAGNTRAMRASMLGVTTQDYIKTARSKGLTEVKVVLRHQLKNSLIPIITGLGPTIAAVMLGSFVVEQIFVIPGLGRHFVNSVNTLDYPLVMGMTIFYGSILVFANLLVDILYGVVDPRIRYT